MTRMVQCVRLGHEAEALDFPPVPGGLGQRIYENISKEAWQQWLKHQTMLINENRLSMLDPRARQYLLKQCEELAAGILPAIEDRGTSRLFLPGFRLFDIDEASWKKHGWDIDDYLPHCGISSTASAFGLARALLSRKSTLVVHCNQHATGRQALIAAITK